MSTTAPADAAQDVQIAFEQFQQPGLKDGKYTVTAVVALADTAGQDAPQFASVSKTLQVGSDATALPAGSLGPVFPPEHQSGEYTGCLPHVLLTVPTIPWQKNLESGADDQVPWLALISLTDAELAANAKVVKGADGSSTLSMPLVFFRTIAPTADDIAWLAHVREVETTRKADSDMSEVDYAIVVGNRLVQPGDGKSGTNAFLVALVDQGELLPGGSATTDPVVLPILESWQFFAAAETRTFADVILAADRSPPTLGLPPGDGDAGTLLKMGYVPMPHALRVGGATVSLYRGPLVPYRTARTITKLPIENADAVTFYDPSTGVFDTSCAAAWTLGRLLALNSSSYAVALYSWKRKQQRATIDKLIYELDTGHPPPADGALGQARRANAERALAAFLPHALAPLGGFANGAVPPTAAPAPVLKATTRTAAAARRARGDRHATLKAAMTDPARIAQLHGIAPRLGVAQGATLGDPPAAADPATDPNLTQVLAWLGDLALLKTVPLFYLIPDERMLPAESIRFFQVDPSWMEALIDGALSLGRVTAADQAHDQAFRPLLLHHVGRTVAAARDRRRKALGDADPVPPPAQPVSGFFLRSSAVTQWGIEVEASGASGAANILRMEKSGAVLICLFDRVVDTVTLHQPGEGVHFGFHYDPSKTPQLTKVPRRIVADLGGDAGTEIKTDTPMTPLYRSGAATGVLDVAALAAAFKSSLAPKNFTSAEFALEMVAGVDLVTFGLS